jgi:hypothetical protein
MCPPPMPHLYGTAHHQPDRAVAQLGDLMRAVTNQEQAFSI